MRRSAPAKKSSRSKSVSRKAPVRRTVRASRAIARPAAKRKPYSMKYPGVGAALGAAAGSVIPGVGSAIGGLVGGAAHKIINAITGFGEYKIEHNAILKEGSQVPVVMNGKHGKSFVIRHREYIGDIFSSATPGAFNMQSFELNPGVTRTFPWLASLANHFQEYEFQGLVFDYKSTSGDALNSTNTQLGTVAMATLYNAGEPDFQDLSEMMNSEYSIEGKSSQSMLAPIECARALNSQTHLYVRSAPTAANQDIRWFDLGKFFVATQNVQGASVRLGQLFVTYQVELFKPIMRTNRLPTTRTFIANSGAAVSSANPFGTSRAILPGCTFTPIISGATFNYGPDVSSGLYAVSVCWIGSAGAAITYPVLTLANASIVNYSPGTTFVQCPPAATTSSICRMDWLMRINGPGAGWTFGAANYPGGTLSCIIQVTQVPSTITPSLYDDEETDDDQPEIESVQPVYINPNHPRFEEIMDERVRITKHIDTPMPANHFRVRQQ